VLEMWAEDKNVPPARWCLFEKGKHVHNRGCYGGRRGVCRFTIDWSDNSIFGTVGHSCGAQLRPSLAGPAVP